MNSFDSHFSECLEAIHHNCDAITKSWLSTFKEPPPLVKYEFQSTELDINGYGEVKISQALQRFRLSQSLTAKLLHIYLRAVDKFSSETARFILKTRITAGPSVSQHEVVDTLQIYMRRQCDSLQNVLLAAVEDGKKRLEIDVSDSAADDNDDESDDGDSGSDDEAADPSGSRKQHPPQALAILERAFERTNNITHAEKNRIAKAIGLTPRQVTVWFQNRRNRRKISKPVATPGSPPGSSKKRKLASVNDEEMEDVARTPSTLPEKRQRCARSASDASCISSSSSSCSVASFESEWTPQGVKYGRTAKPRNESGDSSFTSITSISSNSMDSSADSSQECKVEEPESYESLKTEEPLRAEQPAVHDFLFHPDGSIQPDWDDLELDLGQLEQSLAESLAMGASLGSSPSPVDGTVQPLTASALQRMEDRTPTANTTFADQQGLPAHPSIAAFTSISQAENWSFLESGVLDMPAAQDHSSYSNDDWQRALVNIDCDASDFSAALSYMDEVLSKSEPGQGHHENDSSQFEDYLSQLDKDSALSMSSRSSTACTEDSKLHLDFDFDFSKLGFSTSPVATPSTSSEATTFSTVPEADDKLSC
ncbi:hypothetical protein CF327_g2588 [Tilletia walkeri]|nr:hypothetical protein CF327_g2588 [Tilletia walkeri]